MQQSLDVPAADPGRLHAEGLVARDQLELARTSVADFLGAQSQEVVFTSCATEAINAAIWSQHRTVPGSIVLSAAEHAAVRLAAERTGRAVTVDIDQSGLVTPEAVAEAIDREHRAGRTVALVCCQLGNHEVGTIQPISAIAQVCHARGVAFLVDAAQAAGRIPFDFAAIGATFAAVSGHKLGGPAGTGALLVRNGVHVEPLLIGGAQERALRAGLENTVAAIGFGAACAELADTLQAEATAARLATDRLRDLVSSIEGTELFGPEHPDQRLPHLVCAGVADIEPKALIVALDQAGVAAHSGSAYSSAELEPSPILAAMGVAAEGSLRLAVGWHTTDDDIDAVSRALPAAVARLRSLRLN